MVAPSTAPLNGEPAKAEERAKKHLAPKSYADAVEQEPHTNAANGTNDVNVAEDEGAKQPGHKASVLRIVDTGALEMKDKLEERPQFERQESKHEYSATVGPCSSCPSSAFTYHPTGPRRYPANSSSIQTSKNWIKK
jgi:2-acylglycerol O-acyltransferase 2